MTTTNHTSAVAEFLDHVETDAESRVRLAAAADSAAVTALAAELGYHFAAEEYDAHLDRMLDDFAQVPGSISMSGPAQCPSRWPT